MDRRSSTGLSIALALTAACATAQERATGGDAACREALVKLDAAEAETIARHGAAAERAASGPSALPAMLLEARRQAARACLGGRGDPITSGQRQRMPISVPPVTLGTDPPPRPALPRAAPTPPAPLRSGPPTVITQCDSLGCWTSDGQRLPHAGHQQLLGPRGICNVNGSVVQCP